jgi:hypothetical protein
VWSDLDALVARALNVTARSTKRERLAFSTSEDAVTWTVLRGLQGEGRLDALIAERPGGEPSLLLWGAPAGGTEASRVAELLVSVSDELGEDPRRRSEPDVVVVWPEVVVVIEAKYRSGNDRKPAEYPNWGRYLTQPKLFAVPVEKVRRHGFYELTRNWCLAARLADRLGDRRALLVNLGRPPSARSAAEFATTLAIRPDRDFSHRTWSEVLSDAAPLPSWLQTYADDRGLTVGAR